LKLSIIIPVRDDLRVQDLVRSLTAQLPPDAEILIADDGTPGRLPDLPGARVLQIHSGNPGNARNEAAGSARGEVLLFLDADVVVPPGWVRKAQSLFADPRVLAAQGYSEAIGGDPIARRMQEEYERFVASHQETGYRDLCDTRCFGIRREVFDRFRFEVEERYCEDGVLGRRLFEAGIAIHSDRDWKVGHHYTRSAIHELSRLRRYAASSVAHWHRTGRDLFRAPGAAGPRGPGAFLLRQCARWQMLGPPAAAFLWLLAMAAGMGGFVREPWGPRLFSLARRAAVLSVRVKPGRPLPVRALPAGALGANVAKP
jgi:glycosyltransferase involved in cell wall biosynthesis